MTGLVGGEYEAQDRIGLSGGGFGGLSAQGFTDRQGFGGGYGGGYGLQSTCPQGVNQNTALLATAAAIAVGAAILFREITQNQRRRRRRRRRRAAAETGSADQQDESADYRDSKMDTVFSLVHVGIQKFAGIDSN